MKISTTGRYGLRILIDLATHDPAKPRLIRDIAQSQQISEKYISRLVIDLRRAKLIRSVRGVNGGFHLAKLPEQITLLEVLETMEGPISVVDCVRSPEKCKRQTLCPARSIWTELDDVTATIGNFDPDRIFTGDRGQYSDIVHPENFSNSFGASFHFADIDTFFQ